MEHYTNILSIIHCIVDCLYELLVDFDIQCISLVNLLTRSLASRMCGAARDGRCPSMIDSETNSDCSSTMSFTQRPSQGDDLNDTVLAELGCWWKVKVDAVSRIRTLNNGVRRPVEEFLTCAAYSDENEASQVSGDIQVYLFDPW